LGLETGKDIEELRVQAGAGSAYNPGRDAAEKGLRHAAGDTGDGVCIPANVDR